jgi:hypothetical protein
MDSKKIYGANIGNIFLTQMRFIEILLPKQHFPLSYAIPLERKKIASKM